jgi:formylglycine-generating enzyme required for sulfatase activity
MWFVSGIVMMYWSYPEVTTADRLSRAPELDPSSVKLPAADAFARAGEDPPFVLLSSFDGRPVYIGGLQMIHADDGTARQGVDAATIDRAAAAWAARPAGEATRESIDEPDIWTLSGTTRGVRPLYKYSWPDGQQVYVDGTTADIVQYTTRSSRFWAWLGAIPHWFYIPVLRTDDAAWFAFIAWASLLGAIVAAIGLAVAAWMYSPRKIYVHNGTRTGIPYRGWKRWHTVLGLSFGVMTLTWSFSGMLSIDGFDVERRLTDLTVPAFEADESVAAWSRMSDTLRRGRLDLDAYAARPPQAALTILAGFGTREIEYTSFGGEPVYLATNGRGDTRIVPMTGTAIESFDRDDLMRRLREAGGSWAAIEVLASYDAYYRDRRGELPLPVIEVRMKDAVESRYYIDPRTANVVGSYSGREWVGRWLYNGLHSLDFPWLYNNRPLWDIVVIMLMLGGTALSLTSVVLMWRVLVRRLAFGMARRRPPREDLIASVAVTCLLALAAGDTLLAQSAPAAAAIEWARIPAGSFQMGCVPSDTRCNGDEQPRHKVTLTESFDLMTTEVTIGMYRAAVRNVDDQPPWSTGPNHPVVIVTWDEAEAFCETAGGRLPTEAEWEYAARGGRDGSIYPWGDSEPAYESKAPTGAVFESDRAQPVKSFGPNGYGLFDMAGNVWEWTADAGTLYLPDAVTDPLGPAQGSTRIVRGGSFGDDARDLRVSNRTPNQPGRVNVNVGFRCARDVMP